MNDTGIVTSPDRRTHLVIVIFTKGAKSSDAKVESDIAAVTAKVYKELMP